MIFIFGGPIGTLIGVCGIVALLGFLLFKLIFNLSFAFLDIFYEWKDVHAYEKQNPNPLMKVLNFVFTFIIVVLVARFMERNLKLFSNTYMTLSNQRNSASDNGTLIVAVSIFLLLIVFIIQIGVLWIKKYMYKDSIIEMKNAEFLDKRTKQINLDLAEENTYNKKTFNFEDFNYEYNNKNRNLGWKITGCWDESIDQFRDKKEFEKYRLDLIINYILQKENINVLDGEKFGFTKWTSIARMDNMDVQVKLIAPMRGVERYEELDELDKNPCGEEIKIETIKNIYKLLNDELIRFTTVINGEVFGLTSSTLVVRAEYCDIQIKLMWPKVGFVRYEEC